MIYVVVYMETVPAASRAGSDRLSDLPDCLLHIVLSSLRSRQVVQTCLLSRRWRQARTRRNVSARPRHSHSRYRSNPKQILTTKICVSRQTPNVQTVRVYSGTPGNGMMENIMNLCTKI